MHADPYQYADLDPRSKKSAKKSRETYIKIDKSYQNIIFSKIDFTLLFTLINDNFKQTKCTILEFLLLKGSKNLLSARY